MCRGRVTVIVCQTLWTVGSKWIPVPLLVSHSDWSASYYTLASHWSTHCAGLACLETRHLMKLAWTHGTHVSSTAWRVGRWPVQCVTRTGGMTGKVKVLPQDITSNFLLNICSLYCVLLNCCNVDNHVLLSQAQELAWLGKFLFILRQIKLTFHCY